MFGDDQSEHRPAPEAPSFFLLAVPPGRRIIIVILNAPLPSRMPRCFRRRRRGATESGTRACVFAGAKRRCTRVWAVVVSGYRYYNPSTGRWISRDPIKDPAFALFETEHKGYAKVDFERKRRFVELLANVNPELRTSYKSDALRTAVGFESIPLNGRDISVYAFVDNNPQGSIDRLGLWKMPYYFECPTELRSVACIKYKCRASADVENLFPKNPILLGVCLGESNLMMTAACLRKDYDNFRHWCHWAATCISLYW